MKNKRGVSQHLEMILATVLFVTFFAFILIFIQPQKTESLTNSIIEGIYYNFKANASIDVTTVFVKLDTPAFGTIYITLPQNLQGLGSPAVFNLNGIKRTASINEEKLYIQGVNEQQFYISFSEDFEDGGLSTGNQVNAEIGSVSTRKIISIKNLGDLKSNYDNDYNNLKNKIAMPSQYDFAISTQEIIMEREIPTDVTVLAEDYLEEMVYENGTIINSLITIKAW